MTWDEVLEQIRTSIRESEASLRACSNLVAAEAECKEPLNKEAILTSLIAISMAVSSLHNAVSGLALGVEAVVETMREASPPQDGD